MKMASSGCSGSTRYDTNEVLTMLDEIPVDINGEDTEEESSSDDGDMRDVDYVPTQHESDMVTTLELPPSQPETNPSTSQPPRTQMPKQRRCKKTATKNKAKIVTEQIHKIEDFLSRNCSDFKTVTPTQIKELQKILSSRSNPDQGVAEGCDKANEKLSVAQIKNLITIARCGWKKQDQLMQSHNFNFPQGKLVY